jgi:integrase
VAPFPKSARGEGTISLDLDTLEKLQALRAYMEERAAFFGTRLTPTAYVFSSKVDGNEPLNPQSVTKHFERLRRSVGLGNVRLHDLRHFAATQLLTAGFAVNAVAGRLGNSPAVLLGRYAHWVQAQDDDQAKHLGALVSPPADRS